MTVIDKIQYVQTYDYQNIDPVLIESSHQVLASLLSGKAPSESLIEQLLDNTSPLMTTFIKEEMTGINFNDDSTDHHFELEGLRITGEDEQMKLLKANASHRYLAAIYFDNKSELEINFPALDMNLSLQPKSILLLPVSLTYRFNALIDEYPLNALCLYTTMDYEVD